METLFYNYNENCMYPETANNPDQYCKISLVDPNSLDLLLFCICGMEELHSESYDM